MFSIVNVPNGETQAIELSFPPSLERVNFSAFGAFGLYEEYATSGKEEDAVRHPSPSGTHPFKAFSVEFSFYQDFELLFDFLF